MIPAEQKTYKQKETHFKYFYSHRHLRIKAVNYIMFAHQFAAMD